MSKFRTITKAELIESLEDLNDDDAIAFASDYGDIVHTMQVHRIQGVIDEAVLEESAYSDSGFAIRDPESDECDDEQQKVFILS
jgi:hypothetical protein